MPKVEGSVRQQNKEKAWLWVKRSPNGITEAELEEKSGIQRRTLNNYLRELEYEGKIYKDGLLWLALDFDGTRLRSFDLSPEEAYTLYLATRLLVKQHDKRNEPAETALMKLAHILTTDAKVGAEIAQAAQELSSRPANAGYQDVFRTLVRGYIYRKAVRITYRPLNGRSFETTFHTYLMEPSAIGYATYAIGYSSTPDALRAYKIERISAAQLAQEKYDVPMDFPGLEILRHAWSIIFGEETIPVELRFGPKVKERVLETQWHPSQRTDDDKEKAGWLTWTANVADTKDMLPWIRGWGADVEVVGPQWLREELKREAQRLGRLYEVISPLGTAKQFYAHTREDRDETEWQLLKDHLIATGEIAFDLGRDANVSQLAQVAALLHDIGKYSDAFQARLRGSKRSVDHATAGAREVRVLFPNPPHRDIADLLSYCIAGHHTGLPDYGSMGDIATDGTLLARREKKKLEDYSAYKSEIEIDLSQMQAPRIRPSRFRFGDQEKPYRGFSIAFLTRMIFSTLVDADWLDTERFVSGEKPRGQYASIEALAQEFERYMHRFADPQSAIDRKRTETLHTCIAKADHKPGFFTLTVPTGGAKTLTSMAFALKHALAHGMKRIIYVIPFTSIIEQNAAVFREALGPLGEENILEHHSNLDWEQLRQDSDHEGESAYEKLKLAAENWDIPIVVTTNVQFFESLFANKKSRSRKLHNIANSVIIFDEVQMLPRDFLKPCLLAVSELVQNYGTSVVLSTATQPALEKFFPAGTPFTELAPDPPALFDFYRRVSIESLGSLPDDILLKKLNEHMQVLCIVNTRRHAKGLFDQLTGEGNYHLSTLMCPAHRKQVLTEIRERLEIGEPCRVVSTQVMEAGIDVDFPVGYRAMAGLDSIIQAAGRVNREGRHASGQMFVFQPETPFITRTPAFIEQTSAVAQSTLRTFANDPTTILAINGYYQQLYVLQNERAFDTRQILNYFEKGTGKFDFDFKTAAENFKLIDDNTVAVIIPYNHDATEFLETLKYTLYPMTILRKLQPFTVNIYEREFRALQSLGAIQTVHEQYHTLDVRYTKSYYHAQTGLVLPESSGGVAVFFD